MGAISVRTYVCTHVHIQLLMHTYTGALLHTHMNTHALTEASGPTPVPGPMATRRETG